MNTNEAGYSLGTQLLSVLLKVFRKLVDLLQFNAFNEHSQLSWFTGCDKQQSSKSWC